MPKADAATDEEPMFSIHSNDFAAYAFLVRDSRQLVEKLRAELKEAEAQFRVHQDVFIAYCRKATEL